jgi:carbon storage regulator
MLVLTRRLGEEIVIGGRIKITIVQFDLRHERVRIGVEAPPEIAVHRGEIFRKILEENRSAVVSQEAALKKVAQFWANQLGSSASK